MTREKGVLCENELRAWYGNYGITLSETNLWEKESDNTLLLAAGGGGATAIAIILILIIMREEKAKPPIDPKHLNNKEENRRFNG